MGPFGQAWQRGLQRLTKAPWATSGESKADTIGSEVLLMQGLGGARGRAEEPQPGSKELTAQPSWEPRRVT